MTELRFLMNENLTILKKGLVLVAVPFLLQLVFIGLLLKTNADVARAQRWALHSKEVVAMVEGTFRKLVEAHSGIRGLLLTGAPVFYDHSVGAIREVPGELERLREIVADNPPQQVRARDIAAKAARLIAWQERTALLFQSGRREEALAEVKNFGGKERLDDVRVAIDEFLRAEGRLDAERVGALIDSSRHQGWALAAGGLLSVVGAVILAVIFGQGITRRFATLAGNVARLAEGKELAEPIAGRDEIARLDRVFHGMARAISEKDRENEMFIYSVSHDLRSPLVNLQGFSQELRHAAKELRDIIGKSDLLGPTKGRALVLVDQDVGGSIHYIQTAVSRLSAIIDALLRLSRAGRVEYRWQPVDVGAAVNRVVEALGSTINERGAEVVLKELPGAWGDPTAVEQVFANLLGNAVNYLDPQRPGVIEVGSLNGVGAGAPLQTYYVKDNGRGIPTSGMAKLFFAFQRFHEGAARGEGIGLALVRRVVERHGGKIRVESEPGVGSTFFVDLPTRPPEPMGDGAARRSFEREGAIA